MCPAHHIPILEFDKQVFLAGRNTTIRRSDRWHALSRARLRLHDGSLSPPVALQTSLKQFSALTADDLQFEHDPQCRSLAGLLLELQRLYPGFDPDEIITVCHFDL